MIRHRPVMCEAAVGYLVPADAAGRLPGGVFLDATVGAGGHARAILESAGPAARVVALDQDPEALAAAAEALQEHATQVMFTHGNFAQLGAILDRLGVAQLDGALFDLGVSSLQLETAQRGFSFQSEGPLDMRMDPSAPAAREPVDDGWAAKSPRAGRPEVGAPGPAGEIVNRWSEADLAHLLTQYGQERWARRIAREMVRSRPIMTTTALAACVVRALPHGRRWTRIHPATRTFQALRIAVNQELASLDQALPEAIRRLRPGARIVVLAYHSLEDRVVKQTFRQASATGDLAILTRRPLRPSVEEVRQNPRSRSARVRVGERVG